MAPGSSHRILELDPAIVDVGQAELGLRLVYGGLSEDRLEVIPSLEAALDRGLELVEAGTELVVLPTYTAMLALRGVLTDRGLVRAYWKPGDP
jgi:hypothetical protein